MLVEPQERVGRGGHQGLQERCDYEKLNDECTSFFKKYNAEENAIGKGLKDWYDLTGHRLLGQYDMTTITAIETPTVMIADLLQCIDHKEHKDHELQRKQDAKKVRDNIS